jgi:hypothetical protein
MTFDDVAHKLAGISAEIAQTQELRVQQTRSLERLSDAVAFQDVPMGYSSRAPIVELPEIATQATSPEPVEVAVEPVAGELVLMDTQWREGLELSEADIVGSATAMQVRGDNHANWLVATADNSPEAVALITQHMSNDAYRESFKEAIQDLYALPSNTEKDIALLDASTGFVDDLVNRVEGRSASDALQPSAAKPADRKVLQGELLAHGAAPYQFNEKLIDKPLSYFVTIKPEVGKPRTVWGVDLERVMSGDPAPFKAGDRIRVEDLGTMPVTVPETQADGSVIQKSTFRREWAADLVDAGKDVANAAPASATAVAASPAVTPIEPEQDHGMNVD